jgi:hypothetical protein
MAEIGEYLGCYTGLSGRTRRKSQGQRQYVRNFKFLHCIQISGNKMSIEVDLPQEIELTIKAKRELGTLVRKRIERDIVKDIKNDIFLSRIFDDLLKDSELTEADVNKIDHKMKKEMMEKLGWR